MKLNTKIILSFICGLSMILSQNQIDLQKIRNELEKSQSRQLPPEEINNFSTDYENFEIDLPIFESMEDSNQHNFFGYDFFQRTSEFEFWDNLPIPSEYILGPGDEIILSLWGETQLRKKYVISREGKIYDEKAGLLNLSGMSVSSADKYLFNQFSKVFSTLKKPRASTFMDLSLGQLRSINVNFVGEVKSPGVYVLHPYSNLITALIQVGGPDTTGTLRSIEIVRDGFEKIYVDLYDYFLNGSISQEIQLRNQDVVVVKPRISTVYIDSSVNRPGRYELKKNEKIDHLLKYSGGITSKYQPKIILNTASTSNNGYFELNKIRDYILSDGDSVTVLNQRKKISQVRLIGRVKRPGSYPFFLGMKLKDLLDLGGGFEDETYLKSVLLEKVEIFSRDVNSKYESVQKVRLDDVLAGDEKSNLLLKNLDKVVIYPNPNFFEKANVLITGEVKIPGSYPILQDRETLDSIIERAGGFTINALEKGIEIYRDTLKVAWQNTDVPIFPGDSIAIKEKPGVVIVKGAVYNPGLIEFQKGRSINYYINAAGGVTPYGDKSSSTVMYSNGFVVPSRRYFSPKIFDGSTITVNPKPEKPPFDFSSIANIASTTLTILVLVNQLNTN